MDVLSDVLRKLQIRVRVTGELQLGAPWAIVSPKVEEASFHLVSQGQCCMTVDGNDLMLHAGDLVLLPHGTLHMLSDQPGRVPVDVAELATVPESPQDTGCRQIYAGGDGPRSSVICGRFQVSAGSEHPLLAVLPSTITIRRQDYEQVTWMDQTLRQLAREAKSSEPGAQIAVDRLVDLLFVQSVRLFVRLQPQAQKGWLSALGDPKVGRALSQIHEQPARAWTVGELARSVGMSRSSFAARFAERVGESPLRYLTGWRMHIAAERITADASLSVAEVARSVGYESEAAFGAAFKKAFAAPPGVWRRQQVALLGS